MELNYIEILYKVAKQEDYQGGLFEIELGKNLLTGELERWDKTHDTYIGMEFQMMDCTLLNEDGEPIDFEFIGDKGGWVEVAN